MRPNKAQTSNGQLIMMQPSQFRKRHPSAPSIEPKYPIVVDTKAGVVLAQLYVKKATDYLKKSPSVTIMQKTELVKIENDQNGVTSTIKSKEIIRKIKAKRMVLSCGRWISQVVPELESILKQSIQTVSYWRMKQPDQYKVGKFPCWVHTLPDQTHLYGLPDVAGMGIKFALHNHNPNIIQKMGGAASYLDNVKQLYTATAQTIFKDRVLKMNFMEKCYYTNTPTEDFVVDWTDQHSNVLIVSACSGHGFKFGPILGRIVLDLLNQDKSIPLFEDNRYLCRIFYHLGVQL